jgi:hypothetical protein
VGRLEGKRLLGRPRLQWEVNIETGIFKKWDRGTWSGLIWLRIGTGGGLL